MFKEECMKKFVVTVTLFALLANIMTAVPVYAQREAGVPQAWTNYDDYATPDADGYAYYMKGANRFLTDINDSVSSVKVG